MICKDCNTDNAPGAAFCEHCGAPLAEHSAAQNNAPVNTASNPAKTVGLVALITGIVSLAAVMVFGMVTALVSLSAYIPGLNMIGSVLSSILSLVSLIVEWGIVPFCTVASIICGIISMSNSKALGCKSATGLAGVILGVATIVMQFVWRCIHFLIALPAIVSALSVIVMYVVMVIGILTQSGGGGYYYGY